MQEKRIEWADFKFPPINLWVMPPWKYEFKMTSEELALWELNKIIKDSK
jgi:hypothetical protein